MFAALPIAWEGQLAARQTPGEKGRLSSTCAALEAKEATKECQKTDSSTPSELG
jgi:hypothetical protein